MYSSEHVGVVRVDPHTYATLSKWTGVTTPQGLYDVLQPLMTDWPKSDCVSAWHGRQAFSLVFPNVHTLAETTIHQLSVAIEEGGGKAFVRLNNSFLPVETETHELEEAFPDNLFSVGRECFVVPCGGAIALRKAVQNASQKAEAPKVLEPILPTAMATIVVPEPSPLRGKDDTVQKTKSDAASKKELKASQRRVRRLEKRIAEAELAKKNLEEHVAILQSSVKSLAEAARNQQRGASCYKALSPVLAKMKKTGQDAGALTQGLAKVYKMLLELDGKAPFEALDDLNRALKWIQSKKKSMETFEGYLTRVDAHNQCLQRLNRALLDRLSNAKQATMVACKHLGTEAVRSTLLEERIKDMDRAYDDGFFQMLTETLSSSMDEEGVTDLPAGMHLLYDAQGLLLGWKRMTKTWAVATPFQGALPNASGGTRTF